MKRLEHQPLGLVYAVEGGQLAQGAHKDRPNYGAAEQQSRRAQTAWPSVLNLRTQQTSVNCLQIGFFFMKIGF